MEGIPEDCKGNPFFIQHPQKAPEIRMQNGVTACDIEIGEPVVHFAEVLTVRHHLLHLLPGTGIQFLAAVFGKDIAVLASLVTVVCDMPLESEVLL